ncbi:succinylglutamate desuccinylase [Colwelliaceae bacterium 6471]
MDNFSSTFEEFLTSGDFLSLTSKYELGIPSTQEFHLDDAKATLLDSGVLLVEPNVLNEKPKDILISSGIHGNETAPIEIVNQLVGEILQGKTPVKQRTLFIIGNPVAMNISERFQSENLNRLFCGKYKNTDENYESLRAEKLESYVRDFFSPVNGQNTVKYHYDLHTAIRASKYEKFAIYPYRSDRAWDKEQLRFLQSSGVDTILFGHAPSGTFSYFTSEEFQAHAFTVELGKVMPFGENNMASFQKITDNLRSLIEDKPIVMAAFDNDNFNLFTVLGDITKVTDEFILHIADDVSNFTDFPVGTLLSTDGKSEYITSQLGESIVFPNANVANGQRAGLLVVPTQL